MRAPAGAGVLFDNHIEVPAEYTPDKRWPLRIQLHGGVNRPPSSVRGGSALEGEDRSPGGGAPGAPRQRRENRIRGESQIRSLQYSADG